MRFFTQQFGWIFTKSQKRKKSLSLFIIDIDHFKEINDFHGHQAGNTVLAQFSSILKNRTFPPRTMFARIGGEEFAVLLQNVGTEQAALIADFFREEVERAKFPYNPASGKVTVSIGVASASSNFSTTESLFEAADQALYQAKQNGRNQIAVHQGEIE
ncbi:GGDEF domain-containing protein, partial [Listeria monocytogenes]|nr:GGDEF domain-containing protein [Listeria monocytogenes]